MSKKDELAAIRLLEVIIRSPLIIELRESIAREITDPEIKKMHLAFMDTVVMATTSSFVLCIEEINSAMEKIDAEVED